MDIQLEQKLVSHKNELHWFEDALKTAGLPYQDLNPENQILVGYFHNELLIGTGGLEIIEKYGLLRSVSVSKPYQHKNIGANITHDILEKANQQNLSQVYLLTETAKEYFKKFGFTVLSRELVPQEIKSTTEFSSVCPVSATCMVKTLSNSK